MAQIYEIDRNADCLIILSDPDRDENTEGLSKASGNPAKGTKHVNGVANGESHEVLRLKVSSKHLSLASQHFRNKFGRDGESFTPIDLDGRVHFRLEGFDPTAVTTVMNIIHSQGRRVPKFVDLESLTKLATFVDAFKFDEAVEAYGDRWITSLSKSVPSKYNKQAIQWLFIAHAFQHPDIFRNVTRLAIMQSTGSFSELGAERRIPEALSSKNPPNRRASNIVAYRKPRKHRRQEAGVDRPCRHVSSGPGG